MRIFPLHIPLALLMLTSCGHEATVDPEVPKGESHVQVSVTEATGSGTTLTWTDANAQKNEMMRQATVVVADASGVVQRIVHVSPTNSNEVEREIIDLGTLANGTYTFYNFGNLDDGYGHASNTHASFNHFLFETGQKVPDGVSTSTTQATFNNYDPQSSGIPMTNIEQHTIKGGSQRLVLQLYRQLAKMRLQMTNETAGKVRIHRVTIGNITTNGNTIDFFPTKQTSGDEEYAVNHWPDGTTQTTADFTAYEAPADEEGTTKPYGISIGTTQNLPDVYLNESQPKHITGQVPISVQLDRHIGINAENGDSLWDTETRHALLNLTDIPRNALVVVPVHLIDYMLELEAFFYPPIGGYPPFSMEKKNEEYYATFHGSGDFQLIPHLYKWTDHADPTQWFSLNDAKVVVQDEGQKPSIQVADNDQVFSTQPYIDNTTGEILGTLSGKTGHATVTLTAYIRVNDTEIYEYHRTIHIIALSE